METVSIQTVAILVPALLFIFYRLVYKWNTLPPGPRGIPLFGYLFKMPRFLRNPQKFQELISQYGPIMTIPLGNVPLIVVSSPSLIHEALIVRGSVFSSRPSANERQRVLSNNRRTINAATYNSHWRALRRNMVSRTIGRMQSFCDVRSRVTDRLVERLRLSNRAVPVLANARFAVYSILSYMCFGVWLEDGTISELEAMLRQLITNVRGGLRDFVPLVRMLQFYAKDEKLEEIKMNRESLLLPLIKHSRKLAAQGGIHTSSYMSSLLELQIEDAGLELTDIDFVVLCSEFMNAGADTTANALEWCLANLIKFPHHQKRLAEEIQSEVGDKPVTEGDLEKLVFLKAVVKETLRRHPPGYTTLPHAATQPCKLGGYDIPTNASLLFNVYAVNNSPELWDCPSEFRPDRFLGDQGVHADFNATSKLNLVTFGTGRRICPGMGLALVHIQLILARLVQEFEWSSCQGEEVDLTPKQEFTVVMRTPLKADISVRRERCVCVHITRLLCKSLGPLSC